RTGYRPPPRRASLRARAGFAPAARTAAHRAAPGHRGKRIRDSGRVRAQFCDAVDRREVRPGHRAVGDEQRLIEAAHLQRGVLGRRPRHAPGEDLPNEIAHALERNAVLRRDLVDRNAGVEEVAAIRGMGGPCGHAGRGAAEARQTSVARFGRRRPGLRIRLEGALAPVGHELIELGAVFSEAQPRKEFLELALLVFEALQRLGAIIVEGAVAARSRTEPVAGAPDPVHPGAHALHFFLHAGHLALPAVRPMFPVGHRSIPYVDRMTKAAELSSCDQEAENQESYRPPPHEPQDCQNESHGASSLVNVMNIYICWRPLSSPLGGSLIPTAAAMNAERLPLYDGSHFLGLALGSVRPPGLTAALF